MKKSRVFSKWYILPAIVLTMALALVTGFTMAGFSDQATSTGNSESGWLSTQWMQTTQADFEAGIATNVNTTLSVNDVILNAGTGAGANMILLWDGAATAPTGWTFVSNSGGAFYQRFPRGAATYGGTGGVATHTHTVTEVSLSLPTTTTQVTGSGTNRSLTTHTHNLGTHTTDAESNLPLYRNLRMIQSTGIPTTIPAGAIAIFDAAPPTGWTRYSAEDGYYVRGEAAALVGGTGGTNDETHVITVSLAAAVGNQQVATTTPRIATANNNHTHANVTGSSTLTDKQPQYITVILAKADTATSIPGGMIAMFSASPTGDWDVVSDAGGPFNNRFIKADTTYGTTGGADTHTPPNAVITSAASTGAGNSRTSTSSGVYVSASGHMHDITVSLGAAANTPPYRDVIFAKALYAASGTLASQVYNTSVTGSTWDGLAWAATKPAGTNVSFDVRSSDSNFLSNNGTLAWIPLGNVSPVISITSPGRYKQWRATLTADATRNSTPTMAEVRTYFYGP